MKSNLYAISLGILGSLSFSQTSSPAALSVVCANPKVYNAPDDYVVNIQSFKFVVEDSWQNATMTLQEGGEEFPFKCNGQKFLDADFKCHPDLPPEAGFELPWTFLRDTKNKMSFEMIDKFMSLREKLIVYECI